MCLGQLNFILLTHSRELSKLSNTGRLVLDALGARVRRVVWARKAPDELLLELIAKDESLLLYPVETESALSINTTIGRFTNCIIIDGTWQEARKIYNRSDYLHQLPRLALMPASPSCFHLRRNQKPDGLSTVETVVEILKLNSEELVAKNLYADFVRFQSNYCNLLKPQLPENL